MEVSKAQSPFLFNAPSSISGGRRAVVSEIKDLLNTGRQARSGENDLVSQSLNISRVQAPPFETVGALTGFRMGKPINPSVKGSEKTKLPIVEDIQLTSRFTDLKIDRLHNIRDALRTLNTTVNTFLNNSAFNLRMAESSREDLVKVQAGKTSPTIRFTVTPTRKAVNSTLASDQQTTPIIALGLNGSFYVNGSKISVATTDSIFELRDKINRGEDTNNNSKLDGAEDINNNNSIDTISFRATEFGPGLHLTEDLNGNGRLDPGEDINDNNRLNGGTLENRVKANIIDNRLILSSLAGGSTRIDLRDDDNILLELGFFELNLKGLPVQKELQFTSDYPSINLNIEPQPALADIDKTFDDPKTVESDFDKFINISEDTVVEIQETSSRKSNIQIFIDATNTLDQIKTFFNQFNDSIRNINDALSQSKEFFKDREIQNIRNDLTLEPQKKTITIERRNEGINTFGTSFINQKVIGFSISNKDNKTAHGFLTPINIDTLKEIVSPLSYVHKDFSNHLISAGIRTISDNTFIIDEPKLERALEVNAEETLRVFTDENSGILPLLSKKLKNLLRENLGVFDQKQDKILIHAKGHNSLVEKLHKFTETSRLDSAVKNLISVA